MMTKRGLFAATVFSALTVCSARDINAQPHINVTQGQPLAGCSGRIENLRPPVMNWAIQNPIDPNKAYVLSAARILEPATGEIVRGGSLVVRGACIVGIRRSRSDRARRRHSPAGSDRHAHTPAASRRGPDVAVLDSVENDVPGGATITSSLNAETAAPIVFALN